MTDHHAEYAAAAARRKSADAMVADVRHMRDYYRQLAADFPKCRFPRYIATALDGLLAKWEQGDE